MPLTFLIKELNHALRRCAHIYANLSSFAYTADAHHLTQPLSNGEGALRSMDLALKRAQISPNEVDYINAHATSTPLGDSAENKAVANLFSLGDPEKRAEEINVGSTKGATGHLLGAAGAIEAIWSVCAIRDVSHYISCFSST